jgi:hypothetical protein
MKSFFLAAGTSLLLCLGCGRMAAQSPPSVAEQYLFAAANADRVQRGLPALRWNEALYRAATAHARQMAARASISHQYPGEPDLAERGRQAGAHFSVIAENVAEAPTAIRIHDAWMSSPGHRANLLDAHVDSVGIRVERRQGQLYAVEDFDRAVAELSVEEQERTVAGLIASTSRISVLAGSDDARRTCTMDSGYAGDRRPWFVMRYTAADLSRLPDALTAKLDSGRFHQAAIGACSLQGHQSFTAFDIAVLLYP